MQSKWKQGCTGNGLLKIGGAKCELPKSARWQTEQNKMMLTRPGSLNELTGQQKKERT